MSAPHMTWREVKRRYTHIIDGGNGRWQYLPAVCRWDKVGYNAGVNGWNYDVYHVAADICLIDGYRQPNGNVRVDEERMSGYDKEACELLRRMPSEYAKGRPALRRKVMNYIRKTTEGGKP